MKKRIIALLMAVIMSLLMLPAQVFAAENTIATTQNAISYSDWAMNDLSVGDTYGIIPQSWYGKDMTAPISMGDFRGLLYKLRIKLLDTDCVITNPDLTGKLDKALTVETVLRDMFNYLNEFEFTKDVITSDKAIDFMKDNGIYTGENGELKLKDRCSVEQACVFATRLVTYIYNELDAGSKGFLWVTKSGENTVYMLGSIHMASTYIYPFGKNIIDAYNSSDALVVEANILNADDLSGMLIYGFYTDGSTLKDHVSAETYQMAVELGALIGFDEATISLCKPWLLYTLLTSLTFTGASNTTDAAQSAMLGIDMNLLMNAATNGKPILEIEGLTYQYQVLDSFSDELEEYLLIGTLNNVNALLSGESVSQEDAASQSSFIMDYLMYLWHEGDVESFLAFMSSSDEASVDEQSAENEYETKLQDEYNYKLFTQRDINMADYIDALLKAEGSTTYFVVVGSGHYVSDHSVIDILLEKGYEITQIK